MNKYGITWFDDVVEEPTGDKKYNITYFSDYASPKEEEEPTNKFAEYGKTLLKGGVEGISQLGRALGPAGDLHGNPLQEQTESLNELLPTEDEDALQRGTRRFLKNAPTAVANPLGGSAGTLARTAVGSSVAQGLEEAGAPEWAQTAAELASFMGPNPFKKLIEKGSHAEIVAEGRKFGLTDEQLSPLLQSDNKKWLLSKIANKGRKTQEIMKNSHEALKDAYRGIQKGENALQEISPKSREKLLSSLYDNLVDTPSNVRELIMNDIGDLLSKNMTGDSLINFYSDVNNVLSIGKHTKELSKIKPLIKEAISSISPELGKDFDMINKLYSKYYDISSKLKPGISEKIFSGGKALSALWSIMHLDVTALGAVIGADASRRLARQMLTNPKLQQLFPKMIEALNNNQMSVAKKLMDSFGSSIKKENPELYSELKSIDVEDLRDLNLEE